MRHFLHYWNAALKLTYEQALTLLCRFFRFIAFTKENPHRGSSFDEFMKDCEEEDQGDDVG